MHSCALAYGQNELLVWCAAEAVLGVPGQPAGHATCREPAARPRWQGLFTCQYTLHMSAHMSAKVPVTCLYACTCRVCTYVYADVYTHVISAHMPMHIYACKLAVWPRRHSLGPCCRLDRPTSPCRTRDRSTSPCCSTDRPTRPCCTPDRDRPSPLHNGRTDGPSEPDGTGRDGTGRDGTGRDQTE